MYTKMCVCCTRAYSERRWSSLGFRSAQCGYRLGINKLCSATAAVALHTRSIQYVLYMYVCVCAIIIIYIATGALNRRHRWRRLFFDGARKTKNSQNIVVWTWKINRAQCRAYARP